VKHLKLAFSALCFIPVLAIPATFLLNFPDAPWRDQPLEWMRKDLVPVYMLVIFTAVPFGLFVGTRALCRKIGSPFARGLLGGLVAMLWCDTVLISVPYIGMYPSLPSMLIAQKISGDENWGRSAWIWVLVLNAAVWTVIGIAVAGLRARKRPPAR
jgi:hypothetical protein